MKKLLPQIWNDTGQSKEKQTLFRKNKIKTKIEQNTNSHKSTLIWGCIQRDTCDCRLEYVNLLKIKEKLKIYASRIDRSLYATSRMMTK